MTCVLYLNEDEIIAQGDSEVSLEGTVSKLSLFVLLSIRSLVEIQITDNPELLDRVEGELEYLCQTLS